MNRLFLLVFLVLFFPFSGCGTTTNVAPQNPQSAVQSEEVLLTSDDGLFQIRIPVEGLQPDVVPALETQTDPATGEKVYALTPVGEISLLPMTATLPAVNAQGQQNIALFPVEGTGALIPLKTVVVGDRLQAKTVHFSRFGTSGSIPISDEETAK